MFNSFVSAFLLVGVLRSVAGSVDITCEPDQSKSSSKHPGRRACIIFEFPVTELGRQETYEFLTSYSHPNDIERVEFGGVERGWPIVEFIPARIFATFPNLLQYHMRSNLTELRSGDFDNARNLNLLSLGGNRLTIIHNGVFSSAAHSDKFGRAEYPLHKLKELTLPANDIAYIEPNSFSGLNRLHWLDLRFNQLRAINRDTFAGLPGLETLYLNDNQIESIDDGAFDLPSLTWLRLGFNKLKRLSDGVFAHLPKLVTMELAANDLMHIGKSLNNLEAVEAISLERNNVADIDLAELAKLPNLQRLELAGSGFSFATTKFDGAQDVNSPLLHLDIRYNELSNAMDLNKLRIFPNLTELNLYGNPYRNLDVGGHHSLEDILPALRELDLRQTAIQCSSLDAILREMVLTKVSHDCNL